MLRLRIVPCVLALVASAEFSGAQTLATVTAPLSPYVAPLATTSFSAYSARGSLGTVVIGVSFAGVSFDYQNALALGVVMFTTANKSVAYLDAPTGLPNGNYSVQFTFTWVSTQAPVFTFTRGSSTIIATCTLLAATTATQTCNSGVFSVTNGKLDLAVAMTQGNQANLAKITVNQLK